jgi:hypothetical protein
LIKELQYQPGMGLSDFADKINELAQSLNELIEDYKNLIEVKETKEEK